MISHHAEETNYGHAACTTHTMLPLKVAAKKECPNCHHKTSKAKCSKCGGQTEDIIIKDAVHEEKRRECPKCGHKTSKSLCSKCHSQIAGNSTVDQESTGAFEVMHDLVGTLKLAMAELAACDRGVSLDSLMA